MQATSTWSAQDTHPRQRALHQHEEGHHGLGDG